MGDDDQLFTSSLIEVAMENSETLDEKHEPGTSAHVLSSSSFKGSDINESVFYEKFLLDDLDNYWDELNDRLTVSRMVSDSVIKGMVHAVVEESAERIALKDSEITTLNEKLLSYRSNSAASKLSALHCGSFEANSFEANLKWNCIEDFCRLKLAAEEHIRKLKEGIRNIGISNSSGQLNSLPADVGFCSILPQARINERVMEANETVDSLETILEKMFKETIETFHTMKDSVFELNWETEIEREIKDIVFQGSVRILQDEFERKLYEQRSLIDVLNMNWQKKFNELSSLREDLGSLSRSLSSSETGPLLSHNSLDDPEEWNALKRKDQRNHHLPCTTQTEEDTVALMKQPEDCEQPMLEVAHLSQLKHMENNELVAYFKTEMIKMRRQHDSALQEKTEELFKLKREFLREKGNSLFKKDKEFELLKKKIPEVILKLDDILLEKEKPPIVQNDHTELYRLKDTMDTMFSENQHLRFLLSEKREKVNDLSSQVSDAESQMLLHSSVEAKFLKQINKLKDDLEDVKIEACIQHELHDVMLEGVVSENKVIVDDIEAEARIMQDVYGTVIRGFVSDWRSIIDSLILKYFNEKSSLKSLLCEKERALHGEIEENMKLKETVTSLSSLVKENEKNVSETGSTLMQQKQQFDLLNQQIDVLRKQMSMQEILISNGRLESDSLMQRLEEALQKIHDGELEAKKLNEKLIIASAALEEAGKQIHMSEMDIKELKEKLLTTSNALEVTEKEKIMLHDIIKGKEQKLSSSITKEKEQEEHMKSIATCLTELSKASTDFENKVVKNIERNETRLKIINSQWGPLMQQSHLLMKKAMLYKQMLEIRSSNLQKAEAEVDLLGDEVDALLSLLGKIYIALDHYSPVLQHYPGVMEILKLVKRELGDTTTRAV